MSKTTIDEALTMYQQHLETMGTSAISYKETLRRLRLFFPDLEAPISRVTPERAKRFYEAFRQRKKSNGEDISVAYHRATLINARSLLSWGVEQGWLVENPLADVKGVGRRNAGKVQHTGDETRKLYAYGLERAQVGDEAALAVLMALSMALRSSDITRRVVRDVALDASRPMQDGEVEPAAQGPGGAAAHAAAARRGAHPVRMVRLCKGADVPYVCPHALNGTAATLLAETGAAAEVIADHLSHEETSTTKKLYVAPGAAEGSAAGAGIRGDRGWEALMLSSDCGKRERLSPGGSSQNRTENLTRMKRLL